MGVLIDYFVAPTDEAAAVTIDWTGGPSRPPKPPPTERRGLFGRRPKDITDEQAPGYRTLSDTGLDPVVQAGTLEELLTGRSFDDILSARPSQPVASRNNGEQLVLIVSDGLVDALVRSTPDSLSAIAVPWSQTEEFWGQGDPEVLGRLLIELADLARHARSGGENVYAWVSV